MKKWLKNNLPTPILNMIKRLMSDLRYFLTSFENLFIKICSKNGFLASLYYFLFSKSFRREHLAVLNGKMSYQNSLKVLGSSSALLRRNIHRLEKGLIMQPRRDTFAESFITETIETYKLAIEQNTLDFEEKKWITDVIFDYFRVVKQTKTIAEAEKVFIDLSQQDHKAFIPYTHNELTKANISYDELKILFKQRRSIRWYEDKVVPMELIEKAVDIASFAPSACNRQPYSFYISNSKKEAFEIASLAGGTPGWVHNIPCTITIIGDLSAYPFERDRHLIYIDASLAAMQLMLALETLGLSTCSINWPDIETQEIKMKNLMNLKVYQRPIMLLSVGYASSNGGIPYSQKKTHLNIVKKVVL